MPPVAGLYYPWIHFRDADWLKAAMLYWDRIDRIVPAGYPTRDSPTVEAFQARGWVGDRLPLRSAARIEPPFLEVLTRRAVEIRQKYRLDPDLVVRDRRQHQADPVSGSGLAYVHIEKVAYELAHILVEEGLAVRGRGPRRGPAWLGMHPDLAHAYVTALAHDISRRGGFCPLTETTAHHVAVGGLTMADLVEALLVEGQGNDLTGVEEPSAALAFVAIRSVLPANLSETPVDKIIELRDRYGDELRDFQDSVRMLGRDLRDAGISDPEAISTHVSTTYRDRIAPKLEQLERDLRLFNIETVPTWLSLNTSLPPAAALLAAKLGLHSPELGVGGAVFLGAIGIRQNAVRETGGALRYNPTAYLLRVKEGLEPHTMRRQIYMTARRIALGA